LLVNFSVAVTMLQSAFTLHIKKYITHNSNMYNKLWVGQIIFVSLKKKKDTRFIRQPVK
jgi:hypothetical protein